MIFAQVVMLVAVSLITRAATLGFGRTWTALDVDTRYAIATYGVVYSASSTVVVASARISFAVALLRVTPTADAAAAAARSRTRGDGRGRGRRRGARSWGRGRVLVWVVIAGLVCITAVPLVVTRFAICTPFQKVYGHLPWGTCGNTYIPLYLGWASGGES